MTGIWIRKRHNPHLTRYFSFIERGFHCNQDGWHILTCRCDGHYLQPQFIPDKDIDGFKKDKTKLSDDDVAKLLLTGEINAKFFQALQK